MNARSENQKKTGYALCLGVLLVFAPAKTVLADPFGDCNSQVPARILSGCTALIEGKSLDKNDLATAYARRSDAQAKNGDLDAAITDRVAAYDLDPSDTAIKTWLTAAYAVRGTTYIENGQTGIALVYFQAAHLLEPDNETVKRTLAKLYEAEGIALSRKGKFPDAADLFSKAIALGGATADLHVERALAYSGAGETARAMDDFAAALRRDPAHRETYKRRAELYVEADKPRKAIADLSEALRLEPGDIEALLLRAFAFETGGEGAKAAADYKVVLQREPGNGTAARGLTRVEKDQEALVRLLQIELMRVGCSPGAVDGRWGGNSVQALASFARHAGVRLKDLEASEAALETVAAGNDGTCSPPKGKTTAPQASSASPRVKTVVKSCITFNGGRHCDFTAPDRLPESYRTALSDLPGNTLLCTETQSQYLQKYVYVTAQNIYVGQKIDGKFDPNGTIYVIGEQKHFNYEKSYNISSTAPLPDGVEMSNSLVSRQFGNEIITVESKDRLVRVGEIWKSSYKARQWTASGARMTVPKPSHDYDCRLIEGRIF